MQSPLRGPCRACAFVERELVLYGWGGRGQEHKGLYPGGHREAMKI